MKYILLITAIFITIFASGQDYKPAVDTSCLKLKLVEFTTEGYMPVDKSEGLFNSKIYDPVDNYIQNQRNNVVKDFWISGAEFKLTKDMSLVELWNEYLKDCNTMVKDTIVQYGTINCGLVPVKFEGKIVSYKTVPKDTVWDKVEPNDYKNNYYRRTSLTRSSLTGNYGWITIPESKTNYSSSDKVNIDTKRNKVYLVKKSKATMEGFFEWCIENKILETN